MGQAVVKEDLITVGNIMTRQPDTVTSEHEINVVAAILERVPYHHIPVVDDSRLVGILSDRDLAKYFSPFFEDREQRNDYERPKVSEIMTTDLITVDIGTSIDCASILLLENNISCLPVVDDEHHLEGIITWKDILRFHVYHDV